MRDADLSAGELREVLELAARVKADPGQYRRALQDRSVVMLFEKPSLRTRMTFELAAAQLGGLAIFQDHRDGRIGQREPARDISRNLDRWFDAIVARTFAHKTLEQLAKWSSVPVINALSESFHPCQALADYLTLCRVLRFFRRPQAGLRRRCQQCRALVAALRAATGRLGVDLRPRSLRSASGRSGSGTRGRGAQRLHGRGSGRPPSSRAGRGRGVHRCVDEHGLGGRDAAAQDRVCRIQGR